MAVILNKEDKRFYFFVDRIYIDLEQPNAAETIKSCPNTPAVNATALKLIGDLIQDKTTAEAKVDLLKLAIEWL